ncbi:hypothetical protein BDR26DRAFT_873720 [Obelidium mucronatum]|nr:hypothetical protein BDR26DRAFT_873720 [Obelidium mucronatum]
MDTATRKRGRPRTTNDANEAKEIRRAQLRKAQKAFKERKKEKERATSNTPTTPTTVATTPTPACTSDVFVLQDALVSSEQRNLALEQEVALLRSTLLSLIGGSPEMFHQQPHQIKSLPLNQLPPPAISLPPNSPHFVNAQSAQTILKIIPSLSHADSLIDELCDLLLDVGSDCVTQIVACTTAPTGPTGMSCKVKNRDRIISLKERLVQACLDLGHLEDARIVGQVVDDLKREQLSFLERWSSQSGSVVISKCVQSCKVDCDV